MNLWRQRFIDFERDNEFKELPECQCLNHELRRKTRTDGKFMFANQCLECGRKIGKWVKTPTDANNLPKWDEELNGLYHKVRIERRNEDRVDRDKRWHNLYSQYLRSDAWKEKRMRVLRRDKHICQGCLYWDAEVVHHITYQHVGDELSFELVSLCEDCHGKAHS